MGSLEHTDLRLMGSVHLLPLLSSRLEFNGLSNAWFVMCAADEGKRRGETPVGRRHARWPSDMTDHSVRRRRVGFERRQKHITVT